MHQQQQTENTEPTQGNFKGWAIIEMMGRRTEIGYVTTQAFGPAVLFQVDTPELPERDYVLEHPQYAKDETGASRWCPVGTKVRRQATPARSCLVGPASLYAMNPCSEEVALRAIERSMPRPLMILEFPEAQPARLTAPVGGVEEDHDDVHRDADSSYGD